jgi:ABC-type lipoprotein release transport system permease subunit
MAAGCWLLARHTLVSQDNRLALKAKQPRVFGALPVIGAAAMLFGAAIVASLIPATRASRVDVLRALRSE